MPRKRRSVDEDLLEVLERTDGKTSPTPDAVDHLARAPNRITPVSHSTSITVPTFNKEGDVKLFTCQFHDVAEVNRWAEKAMLLHPCSCLEGKASVYGCSNSAKETFGIPTDKVRCASTTLKRTSVRTEVRFRRICF